MRALIFGSSGQDGMYLAELLRSLSIEVVGYSRSGNSCFRCDVSDFDTVFSEIRRLRPCYIFQLAATSLTSHSAIFENQRTIVSGTINILEAVHRLGIPSRVFVTGSGLQFKNSGRAIDEENPFTETSAYALARIQSVYAARYYRRLGVQCYVGYLFHHESPLRGARHVSRYISSVAYRIANGSKERLLVGSLAVQKEWGFARDIVEGIWTLVSQDDVYEAVIGTGAPYTIERWAEECFTSVGLNYRDYTDERSEFVSEYLCLFSNPVTMARLGWSAKTSLQDLAELMVRAGDANA